MHPCHKLGHRLRRVAVCSHTRHLLLQEVILEPLAILTPLGAAQVLRGESDALELLEDEEGDEDYDVDWDELMGTNVDLPEGREEGARNPKCISCFA